MDACRHEKGLESHPSAATLILWVCFITLILLLQGIHPVHATEQGAIYAGYVGSETCQSCHSDAFKDWQNSHHDLAMEPANKATVLGDFQNRSFRYGEVTSTFFIRDGRYWVKTDGADGKLQDFPISHTFGVYPLQQYLISFPDGRRQALGIAWDSRAEAEGGQRWFHLYPGQNVDHRHHLHWTAPDQNWNYMCAECHSTQLQKQYDIETDTFNTQYSEIDVACESCHGAGSDHVAWARDPTAFPENRSDKGLEVSLTERQGVSWVIHPESGKPKRSAPRETSREIDTCARCHSRRAILSEDFVPGQPIGNTHRVNLLEEGLYHADGQPADETYVYGSFLQSRMFHEGVTCSDCHNPHSLALKLPGDQVCAQCHVPDRYASPEHHFHPVSSEGARCTSCHMPTTRFMGVDDRHDHSFRIPRPDVSAEIGSPNACQACHTEQPHEWAAREIRKRYPNPLPGFQDAALTIQQARLGNPESLDSLSKLVNQTDQPLIFRATAATLLARFPSRKSLAALQAAVEDSAPLMRRAAVEALAGLPPELRLSLLTPRLSDSVLDVRLAAALALSTAEVRQRLSPADRALLNKALSDYVAVQILNADRAEAWFNRGVVEENRQFFPESEDAYRMALMRDPAFTPAAVNLYNLLAGTGRAPEAEQFLNKQIRQQPEAASLHLVKGLMQVRKKHYEAAGKSLERAIALDPGSSRARYILATLRFSQQQIDQGFELLAENLSQHPYDYDSLYAMVSYAHQHRRENLFLQYEPRLQAFAVLQ